jgi:phospholipase C
VDCSDDGDGPGVGVVITNRGPVACRVTVANTYDDDHEVARVVRPGESLRERWSLKSSFGWYDLVVEADTDPNFLRRLAGHVENGRDSASDPAIGGGDR